MRISTLFVSGALAFTACKKKEEAGSGQASSSATSSTSVALGGSEAASSEAASTSSSAKSVAAAPAETVFVMSWGGTIGRDVTPTNAKELVEPDKLKAKPLFKPGNTAEFGLIREVTKESGPAMDTWNFIVTTKAPNTYDGLLASKPIPALTAIKPEKATLPDGFAKIVAPTWKTAHKSDYPTAVESFSLDVPSSGCDALYMLVGPANKQKEKPTMTVCMENDKVKSYNHGSQPTADKPTTGNSYSILGALDVNGDGAAELLIDDVYHEGQSAYWLDFSKSPAVTHPIRTMGM